MYFAEKIQKTCIGRISAFLIYEHKRSKSHGSSLREAICVGRTPALQVYDIMHPAGIEPASQESESCVLSIILRLPVARFKSYHISNHPSTKWSKSHGKFWHIIHKEYPVWFLFSLPPSVQAHWTAAPPQMSRRNRKIRLPHGKSFQSPPWTW